MPANMFTEQWGSRKRGREEDNAPDSTQGFGEHRSKQRRFASLPHRQSINRPTSPPYALNANYTTAPPTITPADSDSEEKPRSEEPKSFFSPYSSSPTCTLTPSGPPSPYLESMESSQTTQASEVYSDDFEMTDSVHLSPGSFHNEPPMSITGRIPTPIHSSFAPYIRAEKASIHQDVDFADDEAMVDRFRRGRRLPSPIIEGEMSPSVIVDGLGDMQMKVDTSSQPEKEKETPTKKGHSRSKHSLRNWHGFGGDLSVNTGAKRSFSMGYRADCEKCRNKVPGHFSHIITINGYGGN